MDTIYKASFAAKVISSFYNNKFKKHFGNKINLVCAYVNKNISKFVITNILTSKLVLDYTEL